MDFARPDPHPCGVRLLPEYRGTPGRGAVAHRQDGRAVRRTTARCNFCHRRLPKAQLHADRAAAMQVGREGTWTGVERLLTTAATAGWPSRQLLRLYRTQPDRPTPLPRPALTWWGARWGQRQTVQRGQQQHGRAHQRSGPNCPSCPPLDSRLPWWNCAVPAAGCLSIDYTGNPHRIKARR